MNINTIDFTQGPFTDRWGGYHGYEFIVIVNARGEIIEGFDDHEEHQAEELMDWLNAMHEGQHSPMPSWYKELLQWRAQDAHNVPDSFDDYDEDDIPF